MTTDKSTEMPQIERTIRSYLASSMGNCGVPTDRTIRVFAGMVETGEADLAMFRRLAGDGVTKRILGVLR